MDEVKHIFTQLVKCVEHLHSKGVVHGDIKTLNLVRTGTASSSLSSSFPSSFSSSSITILDPCSLPSFKLRHPFPLSYLILPNRLCSNPIHSFTPSSTSDKLRFRPYHPLILTLHYSHPHTNITSSPLPSGAQWKLIDLDASCVIGIDAVGFKSSSSYVPPEVRTCLPAF